MQALASAWRSVVRNPASTALSTLTLAVGIGLASAMLAVLNGTLWHPLPFPDADRLVALPGPVSAATVDDWSATRAFQAIAGYRAKRYTLTGAGDAMSLRATVATGRLLPLLGAEAAAGRVLSPRDDSGATASVVLSDECWRGVFHGDPSVVGRLIVLNGTPFAVVGIMPPGFRFPVDAERADVYTTVAADRQTDPTASLKGRPRDLMVVARLSDGTTLEQARAELRRLHSADEAEAPRGERRPLPVIPLAENMAASLGSPLRILAWAVAGVVVIACATAAILSLIHVSSRRAEWLTRMAVGASSGRLSRQVLVESTLLTLFGAVLGTLIALAGVRPLLALGGTTVATAARSSFDVTVWLCIGAITAAVALASGVIPALHAAATVWRPPSRLRRRSARAASVARDTLVVVEVALAVTVLAACMGLLGAYVMLAHTDTGLRTDGVLTFRVDLSDVQYPAARRAEFFERLREAVADSRGVSGAAFSALPPFGDLRFTIRLRGPADQATRATGGGAEVHLVSASHFQALGIPLIRGRDFTASDDIASPPVAIISRALASRQFPGQDPIGRTLDVRVGPNAAGPLPVVVGVVGDIRNGTLTGPPEPQVYVPFAQAPMLPSTTYLVHVTGGSPASVLPEIRKRLSGMDPSVPLVAVGSLEESVARARAMPRFSTAVAGLFGSIAVFLAMVSLYSVVAYAALCRRQEFSIRLALGATQAQVARLVLAHWSRVVLPGLCVGAAGGIAVSRVLGSTLYGVQPSPPLTIAATMTVAALLALLAAWLPARAAGRDNLRVRLQSGD